MEEGIEKIYLKKEEVGLLINKLKKYSFDEFLKTDYYELSKGNYCLFAIHFPEKGVPELVNAFISNTIFKNFLKFVIKKYGRKMI